jgi:hypothetical protein
MHPYCDFKTWYLSSKEPKELIIYIAIWDENYLNLIIVSNGSTEKYSYWFQSL